MELAFVRYCPRIHICVMLNFKQFCFFRPFERTITMQKDSNGYIGFVFKEGKIKSIVKDSSAARNGILTDHQLIEVGGQNVVGLKVCIYSFIYVCSWFLQISFVFNNLMSTTHLMQLIDC